MNKDRRKKRRRTADRVPVKSVDMLRVLTRISGGREVDYTENYADLVGVKDAVGRRKNDRRLGDILCSTIETMATNLNDMLEEGKGLRKVRITKIHGKKSSGVAIDTSLDGWEAERPCVGKNYRLYKDDGGLFRSALITEVKPGYFRTKNSLYRIEVLQTKV